MHFKFIGNKVLSKQQNRLATAKKKMTLNTKPTGIKIKKNPSGRPKTGKGKSAFDSSEFASSSRPVPASCVVVTSSMPPSKSTALAKHKLSCSPIKGLCFLYGIKNRLRCSVVVGEGVSKVLAKAAIGGNSTTSSVHKPRPSVGTDSSKFAQNRVKIEGGARYVLSMHKGQE